MKGIHKGILHVRLHPERALFWCETVASMTNIAGLLGHPAALRTSGIYTCRFEFTQSVHATQRGVRRLESPLGGMHTLGEFKSACIDPLLHMQLLASTSLHVRVSNPESHPSF